MKNQAYYTKVHMVFEILSFVMIVAALVVAAVGVITIDGDVPTHYDFKGNPDGYGSPATLLLMPIVMLLFGQLPISGIVHFLDASDWNMPFRVKPARQIRVYRDMMTMVILLELILAAITLFITVASFCQTMTGVGLATTLFIVLLALDIIVSLILAARHNRI